MLPSLSPSCFARCGRYLFPRIAIVFSLLSTVQSSLTPYWSGFPVPFHTSNPFLDISFSHYVSSTLDSFATWTHYAHFLQGYRYTSSWQVQAPYTKWLSVFSRSPLSRVHTSSLPSLLYTSSIPLNNIPLWNSPEHRRTVLNIQNTPEHNGTIRNATGQRRAIRTITEQPAIPRNDLEQNGALRDSAKRPVTPPKVLQHHGTVRNNTERSGPPCKHGKPVHQGQPGQPWQPRQPRQPWQPG